MAATPKVYVICDQNCKFEGMTKEQILTAIAQAVETGTIGDLDTGFITTIKTINGTPLKFFVGEQAAYDALTEEEKNNLFAIITNDTTKEGLLTDIEQLKTTVKMLADWKAGVLAQKTITTVNIQNEISPLYAADNVQLDAGKAYIINYVCADEYGGVTLVLFYSTSGEKVYSTIGRATRNSDMLKNNEYQIEYDGKTKRLQPYRRNLNVSNGWSEAQTTATLYIREI